MAKEIGIEITIKKEIKEALALKAELNRLVVLLGVAAQEFTDPDKRPADSFKLREKIADVKDALSQIDLDKG